MRQRRFEQYTDMIARIYPELSIPTEEENSAGKKRLSRTVTFQVTDSCNLACSYCYQINKGKRRMSLETAKKFVDLLLSGEKGFSDYVNPDISPALIIEFIGGEPFLEIDLIDQICTYFFREAIRLDHPWAARHCISICSNGILYNDPRVQQFLRKHADNISFSITIDGNKELHDSCRVFPDGRPSYDIAMSAAKDWMDRGNYMGSKITIAPGNITHTFDALIHMIESNYNEINANCVYEKGWEQHHATELYWQMKRTADYLLENNLEREIFISLFIETFFRPKPNNDLQNWCFRGDTPINTPNGSILIKDLAVGNIVDTMYGEIHVVDDIKTHTVEDGVVLHAFGMLDTYTTPDHPYLVLTDPNTEESKPIDCRLAYLIGKYLKFGFKTEDTDEFVIITNETNLCSRFLTELNIKHKIGTFEQIAQELDKIIIVENDNEFIKQISKLGDQYLIHNLPEDIESWNRNALISFLEGFATDKDSRGFVISVLNLTEVEQLATLLDKIGLTYETKLNDTGDFKFISFYINFDISYINGTKFVPASKLKPGDLIGLTVPKFNESTPVILDNTEMFLTGMIFNIFGRTKYTNLVKDGKNNAEQDASYILMCNSQEYGILEKHLSLANIKITTLDREDSINDPMTIIEIDKTALNNELPLLEVLLNGYTPKALMYAGIEAVIAFLKGIIADNSANESINGTGVSLFTTKNVVNDILTLLRMTGYTPDVFEVEICDSDTNEVTFEEYGVYEILISAENSDVIFSNDNSILWVPIVNITDAEEPYEVYNLTVDVNHTFIANGAFVHNCGGTGTMLSCDPDGYLYPCIRYMESSLGCERPPYRIGDVETGIAQTEDYAQKVNCLNCIDRRTESTDECFYCPLAEGCSWCFPAGTKIDTPNGLINIEELKIGDIVIDMNGDSQRVVGNLTREVKSELIRIKAYGYDTITTKEHPFYCKKLIGIIDGKPRYEENPEWVEAKDLKNRDRIALYIPSILKLGYDNFMDYINEFKFTLNDNEAYSYDIHDQIVWIDVIKDSYEDENAIPTIVYNLTVENTHSFIANGAIVHNCSAYNYQVNGTPDSRVTYICEMHKARALANAYFWGKVYEKSEPDKKFQIFVPEEWALKIIPKEEWEMLINMPNTELITDPEVIKTIQNSLSNE